MELVDYIYFAGLSFPLADCAFQTMECFDIYCAEIDKRHGIGSFETIYLFVRCIKMY